MLETLGLGASGASGFGLGGVGALGSALSGLSGIANFGVQLSNYKYNKQLQREIFQREDTAVQRRVADLKAAGLSPVLAAGQGAGTGGTVAVNPPQIPDAGEKLALAYGIMKQKQEIAKTDIDMRRTQEEIDYIKDQRAQTLANTSLIKANASAKWQDYEIQRRLGVTSNQAGTSGLIRDLWGIMENNGVFQNKESNSSSDTFFQRKTREAEDYYNERQKQKEESKRRWNYKNWR